VNDDQQQPLPGITLTTGRRALRVSSERQLTVLGSAVVGGGWGSTREILNVHVDDQYDGERPEGDLAAVAVELGVEGPFVGLMTAAYTEFARCAVESLGDLTVAAVVSVGLSNTSSAGVTPPIEAGPAGAAAPGPGTINVILLVDGTLTPAAMVNAVITATEAKTMTLAEWDVKTPEGDSASGTSTDTVVVACTGRGAEMRYAGPATPVGWLAGRTVRSAMTRICEEKITRDGGRDGW
jgi:iron complex transport system ATP-binding protein